MVNQRRIKSITYYPDGLVKHVEFFDDKPLAIYTLTKTVDGKTTVMRKNASIRQIMRHMEK